MSAVHKLPPDLLGQVFLRVQSPDIKSLALVNKSWHEVVSLDSNPSVWGRLLMASGKPGVLGRIIRNSKVCILYSLSASVTTVLMCLPYSLSSIKVGVPWQYIHHTCSGYVQRHLSSPPPPSSLLPWPVLSLLPYIWMLQLFAFSTTIHVICTYFIMVRSMCVYNHVSYTL
jgi:hypothetical protein